MSIATFNQAMREVWMSDVWNRMNHIASSCDVHPESRFFYVRTIKSHNGVASIDELESLIDSVSRSTFGRGDGHEFIAIVHRDSLHLFQCFENGLTVTISHALRTRRMLLGAIEKLIGSDDMATKAKKKVRERRKSFREYQFKKKLVPMISEKGFIASPNEGDPRDDEFPHSPPPVTFYKHFESKKKEEPEDALLADGVPEEGLYDAEGKRIEFETAKPKSRPNGGLPHVDLDDPGGWSYNWSYNSGWAYEEDFNKRLAALKKELLKQQEYGGYWGNDTFRYKSGSTNS